MKSRLEKVIKIIFLDEGNQATHYRDLKNITEFYKSSIFKSG